MGLLTWLKTAQNPEAPAASADDPELPRYPPFLKGLPVAPPERLLATQTELIARLQDGLAFTDERFTTLVRPVIARYAAFVHLLPASEAHHHRGAGGLLRHGLEVAFHAARASQGRVFALDRSPGERRELEPRWRLAAGLAGLCHDLGKPVSDLSVSDRSGQHAWRPLLGSLSDWAAEQGVTHYYLRWRERRHRRHEPLALLVLPRVLTVEVSAWLAEPDPEILSALLAAVAGSDDASVLGALVREADQASVAHDLRENHLDPTASALGVPVDRYLVDGMRRLVRGGRWTINVPGARLWRLPEGLYVVWPQGAEELVALLAADRVPGIPRDPDTLAEILIERGLAVPPSDANPRERYWRLAPAPLAHEGRVVTLTLLRLAAPELVLAGALPAPVGLASPAEGRHRDSEPPPAASVMDPQPVAKPIDLERDAMEANAQAPPTRPASDPQPSTPEPLKPAPTGPVARPAGVAMVAGKGRAPDPSATPSPMPAETATAWLRGQGAGGAVLLALAEACAADAKAARHRLHRAGAQLLVRFPEGLTGFGEGTPAAALDALAAAGLIETDPLAPLRRVVTVDGVAGVRLSAEAAGQLRTLIPKTPAMASEEPENGKVATPTPGRAPKRAPRTPSKTASASEPTPTRAVTAARALVERVRGQDPTLPGGVAAEDGWLILGREAVRTCAEQQQVPTYALIRTLGHLPGCRITPEGGVAVRGETP